MPTSLPVLETGVPNLDYILGGGIPEGDTLLVVGSPGTGKTILSLQILFHHARAGRNVLYISTVSESPLRMFRHRRTLSFFEDSLIGSKVFLLNIYSLIRSGLDQVPDAILQQIREHQITVVALDGFDVVRDLHPDPARMREFLFDLVTVLAAEVVTMIITSTAETRDVHTFEQAMVDGILAFTREDVGNRTIRYVSCPKLRGMPTVTGRHTMTIDAHGIAVFPRFESTNVGRDIPLGNERVAFGLPTLDALMEGGPFARGSIMVTGAVGTGKTLLSLQFLSEGIRRGEKCLFVGFRESPSELVQLAQHIGIDLQPARATGQLEIFHRAPVELLIDQLSAEIFQEVDRLHPQRMVIDSIDEIERAVIPRERLWDYLTALAGSLRNKEVTTVLTREVREVVGAELDFGETPLTEVAANLILLRWVEFRGDLTRILSILKLKGSTFDSSIREFVIEPSGIRVLQKVETAEGLLAGTARSLTRPSGGDARPQGEAEGA